MKKRKVKKSGYIKNVRAAKKLKVLSVRQKNSRAIVYVSETVHEAREFEVATKNFSVFYNDVAKLNSSTSEAFPRPSEALPVRLSFQEYPLQVLPL